MKLSPKKLKETKNIYYTVVEHLIEEGYATDSDSADSIISGMSEEWFETIVEADSLAAFQARKDARLRRQRKKEGVRSDGTDFGHDYSKPITDYAAADKKWERPNAPKPKA